ATEVNADRIHRGENRPNEVLFIVNDLSRSIEPYEEGTSWEEYEERPREYFELHKERIKTDRTEASVLITALGQKTYSRLRDSSSLLQPNKRTHEALV
ncbi:hypothetical protein HPB47_001365, partial [Ixodes persulcatus]